MRNAAALAASLAILALSASGACAQEPPSPDQIPGKRFEIKAEDLPPPYADGPASNSSKVVARGSSEPLAPRGFIVSLFANGLQDPRKLLVLDDGDVLLAEQDAGTVTLLRDADGDGRAETVKRFADGFAEPFGLAVVPAGEHKGDILVADTRAIWRVPINANGEAGETVAVTAEGVFGPAQGHSTRSLVIDPKDGAMYVGVGSMGNIDEEPEPKATIQRFAPDGTKQTTFASGMRNPIGVHFHPITGKLWATVQERDGLGNDLVPDYLTEVSEGDFYGWPYAYSGGKPQPGLADRAPDKVKATKTPSLLYQAHSSAIDFAFVPDSWPPEWRGDVIAALKGSWNRLPATGYKLVHVKFENGKPAGWYENFVTGFWVEGDQRAEVWGRPTSVAFLPDGGLLVADDTGGTIWKIKPDPDAAGAAK